MLTMNDNKVKTFRQISKCFLVDLYFFACAVIIAMIKAADCLGRQIFLRQRNILQDPRSVFVVG